MGRIVSKANALGKAKGYADRDTMTWNVELPIAIYMSKAVQRYRMEWEHDIPVFKGLEHDALEWRDIPWKKMEKRVFKLQKRIYRAANRGDVKTVRQLQKTLMRSWSAKCLAVRRVTQDNQGKKTAGVDGIKSLSPVQRLALVKCLKISRKVSPLRRVWIPKPGTDEKRGLGIPTIHDRALQALVKSTLEPEWEARFEPNSYGFRPGRSCHDAIEAIFLDIRQKPKYVLDADISKCFDKINQEALLRKINTFPTLRQQIKAWLKSGVMDGTKLSKTSEGTPQGGVISPLLANIALHGMEYRIQEAFPVRKPRVNGKQIRIPTPSLIRYADDFVIIHEDITVVQRCQQIIAEWLKDMGLELKPSKTRLTHTLHKYEENVGFNFLGFQVRQHKTGNYRAACDSQGNPLGFKTLITPSKEKQHLHLEEIGRIIDTHKNSPQYALIKRLNPVIKGWANYYSTTVSSEVFSKLDHLTYQKLRAWASHRCAKTNKHNIVSKYWQMSGKDRWRFATQEGAKLTKHSDTSIKGHIKVQGNRSPYDGDWVYWGSRMGKHPEIPTRITKLLKEQQGKCNQCGLIFKLDDLIEVDRIIPGKEGGKYTYGNTQLLHRHCHDNKTREDAHKYLVGIKELEEYLDENPF